MWTLIYSTLLHGFRRSWKLYLTNIFAIVVIILFFAYLSGSQRQLNVTQTVFSGEISLRMNTNMPGIEEKVLKAVPEIEYISRKLRSKLTYRIPGSKERGDAELIGVEGFKDKRLWDFISLREGTWPAGEQEVLIPSSLLEKADLRIGDKLVLNGKNSRRMLNSGYFRISGIYRASGLNLFNVPRLLVSLEGMQSFYSPAVQDMEYCLFFNDGNIPEDVNVRISSALGDVRRDKIASIDANRISMWDVQNISVQFNVFLMIIVVLAIAVIISVAFFVNFNIYTILFRGRRQEIGTLMAFGTPPAKIALVLLAESVLQVLLCTIVAVVIAFLVSMIGRMEITLGFMEVLLLILSGTNRLDLFIQFSQISRSFWLILAAALLADLPFILRIFTIRPVQYLGKK